MAVKEKTGSAAIAERILELTYGDMMALALSLVAGAEGLEEFDCERASDFAALLYEWAENELLA